MRKKIYLNHLNNPIFQGVNKSFILSFSKNDDDIKREEQRNYYLSIGQIEENYSVMIDGQEFFNQLIKRYIKIYKIIGNILLLKQMTSQVAAYNF